MQWQWYKNGVKMKKFFRNPITITFLVLLLLVLILALCGFRITYNPSLDNNWDAISGCAAWAAVVVSGLAIYFAIQAPKKIAEEQNRIALFEKRYEEVKRIGLIFTEFDRIKGKTESILFKETSRKDALQILNDCKKSLAIISENINGMYQYLFDQSICDKIKFIHLSHAKIIDEIQSLGVIIRDQHYVSITDRDWHRIISKDSNILNIHNEILDVCSKVLSLESALSIETGKTMDLRYL